jgi:cob(I)alamin adenosyltransferase
VTLAPTDRVIDRLLAGSPRVVLFDIGGTLVAEATPGTPTSALHAEPVPGILALLEALAAVVAIGAVTNTAVMSEHDVRALLEPCGIAGRLDHIVTSSDVGVAKPDPTPLLVACERFAVEPAQAVYVGNDPVDVDGAAAAGIPYFDVDELLAGRSTFSIPAGSPPTTTASLPSSSTLSTRLVGPARYRHRPSRGAAMPERDAEDIPTDDPRPDGLRRAPSLVLVNTGPGKGKTTAAMGVVLRAVARDWPVAVVQFLKSGKWNTGEEKVCRQLGVDWWAMGDGFTWDSADLTQDQAVAAGAWAHAKALIEAGNHKLVVLDEITYPINWGWIDLDDVVDTIRSRPERVSIICTGRKAPQEILDIADTVSEIQVVKHAYKAGIRAKKGIDF